MTKKPHDDKPTSRDLASMLVYVHIFDANADAVMRNNSKLKRAVGAIVFSLLIAFVLFLVGFLGGNYLWSHFRPLPNDSDQTYAFTCGLLVGGFMTVLGVVTSFGLAPRQIGPKPVSETTYQDLEQPGMRPPVTVDPNATLHRLAACENTDL